MKFWQRTYYSVLLLFLFSISVMIFRASPHNCVCGGNTYSIPALL